MGGHMGGLVLVVLVVLLGALLGATAAGAVAGCPGCARPRPADSIRLEAIKLQILTKLGLKAKPQVKRALPRELVLATLTRAGGVPPIPPTDPHSMYSESSSTTTSDDEAYSDYDDFYGRTSEIITFAEQGLSS